MAKFYLFKRDLAGGYPSAMSPDYGVPTTTDVVWITAPNAFAAETRALEQHREKRSKKPNKNNNSSQVDALPKGAIMKHKQTYTEV
jgi:hypothetical protein